MTRSEKHRRCGSHKGKCGGLPLGYPFFPLTPAPPVRGAEPSPLSKPPGAASSPKSARCRIGPNRRREEAGRWSEPQTPARQGLSPYSYNHQAVAFRGEAAPCGGMAGGGRRGGPNRHGVRPYQRNREATTGGVALGLALWREDRRRRTEGAWPARAPRGRGAPPLLNRESGILRGVAGCPR